MEATTGQLGQVEREHLEIGFIPIVCSAPLLLAHQRGLFAKRGLDVVLRAAPGWSAVKELLVYGKLDAAHMLTPMPLACHLGIDGKRDQLTIGAIQNINGQALTLATKHKGLSEARMMKGLTFGVPYFFSMQYYLLCHWLARNGLDPKKDVIIKEITPPLMPRYLEMGWADGLMAPEPFNQVAVDRGIGFIHVLSKDIWPGHPCCCMAARHAFTERYPGTYRAVVASVIEAQWLLRTATVEEKVQIAHDLCGRAYLDLDTPRAVAQVLTGHFSDGRGHDWIIPDRIDFNPHLSDETGMWIVGQMRRWGQLGSLEEPAQAVHAVLDTQTCQVIAKQFGFEPPSLRALPAGLFDDGPDAQPKPRARYDMEPALRERLSTLLAELVTAVGGSLDLHIDITSQDEVGQLERMLNELVLNLRFIGEQLAQSAEKQLRLREEVIEAQDAALRKLSTPIVPMLEGVLVVPVVGEIDTKRAAQIMDTLLSAITQYQAKVFIIDITGVSDVNAEIAGHLVRLIRAAALLGAEGILTGISAAVAQRLIALDINLAGVVSRNTLRSGIQYALSKLGKRIVNAS